MPIMPSFTGFAQTPNLASSFLGGRASAQKDVEIAQQAFQANQAIQMQQQKLQQDAQQAQMAAEIQKQKLQQDALIANQQLNIKQQYDQQMAALRAQQLKAAQMGIQLKTQQAARQVAAQGKYQERARQLMAENPEMTPQAAYSQSMMEIGPELGMNGTAMGHALRAPEIPLPPGMKEVPGAPVPGRFFEAATGPKTKRYFDLESGADPEIAKKRLELAEGRQTSAEVRSEINRLDDMLKSKATNASEMAYNIRKEEKAEIPPEMEAAHQAVIKARRDIEILKAKLPSLSTEEKVETGKSQPKEYKHASEVPVGEVYNGMRRKEGPWNKKSSWEKI